LKFNYYYFGKYSLNIKKPGLSGARNLISVKSSKSTDPITLNNGNSISAEPIFVANWFNDYKAPYSPTLY